MTGLLIAFEGLDQSGKQTQAESLRDHLAVLGATSQLLSFPDYTTHIGGEIFKALHGERDYPPDVLQLLYVANRGEKRSAIESWIADGVVVICDRYLASSIAYGEAHGIDPTWLTEIQRFLPAPISPSCSISLQKRRLVARPPPATASSATSNFWPAFARVIGGRRQLRAG